MKESLSRQEVSQVFQGQKKFSTPHFVIHWRLTDKKKPRVVFAISSHHGKAHERNLYRRRIRAFIQSHCANCSVDFVFRSKILLSNLSKTNWQKEQQQILKFCEKIIQQPHHFSN